MAGGELSPGRERSPMKIDRMAVKETIKTAMQASACCQNSFQGKSIALVDTPASLAVTRKEEMRTIAVIIMNTLRQRNTPKPSFCLILI